MSKTMNSNKKFQLTADIVNNLFTKMQKQINSLKKENEKLKKKIIEQKQSFDNQVERIIKDNAVEYKEQKEIIQKLKDKNIRLVQKCKKYREERDESEQKLETANDSELSEKYENLKIHFKMVQDNFEDYKENQKSNDTYQTDKKAKEAIAKIKKEQLKYKRLYDKKCRDIKKVKAELEEEKNKEYDGLGSDELEQMGLFKFCCDCGTHFGYNGDEQFDYENNICLECK